MTKKGEWKKYGGKVRTRFRFTGVLRLLRIVEPETDLWVSAKLFHEFVFEFSAEK